jgi:uroporphyrinogen-III decarboxylase
MEKNWDSLNSREKLEERLKEWLSPPGVQFATVVSEKTYRDRVLRLSQAMRLQEPDRVPVILQSGNFPVYYGGSTLQKTMYDYEELRRVWLKFAHDFCYDMDSIQGPESIHSGKVLELVQHKLYKWPGHGLENDVTSYQYVEGEYMLADEYDSLIRDPYEFAIRVFIPRVLGILKPLEKSMPFTYLVASPLSYLSPVTNLKYRKSLAALSKAGKELATWQRVVAACNQKTMAEGLPSIIGAYAMAPFDAIGDSLRGTKGIIMDMYRQPTKLLEALDRITPIIIQDAISMVNATRGIMVGFALHKGDDTFMSPDQFEKFYWPSLQKVILALAQEGVLVWLFAEGRYSTRLETISDLPKGWVTWMFDQTDMVKAKKILGDTTCIAGNVPASLNCYGSAQEVENYCRNLIENCASGGGYILTGGGNLTEAKAENFRAMMVAAKKYGFY